MQLLRQRGEDPFAQASWGDGTEGPGPSLWWFSLQDGDGRSVAQYAAEGGHAEVLWLGSRMFATDRVY